MLLYPTETIYALGVNAFDDEALESLEQYKGRGAEKYTSVLVRNLADIERWAILSPLAVRVAKAFLPGSLTLVLPAQSHVTGRIVATDGTLRFRISPDRVAQVTIETFVAEYDAPLTCTSANVSGEEPATTPNAILEQFANHGRDCGQLEVIDDGPRSGVPSTVVRVIDDVITVHREGAITEEAMRNSVR